MKGRELLEQLQELGEADLDADPRHRRLAGGLSMRNASTACCLVVGVACMFTPGAWNHAAGLIFVLIAGYQLGAPR